MSNRSNKQLLEFGMFGTIGPSDGMGERKRKTVKNYLNY